MKIAVVGLGITGLSIAARLAQAGHAVHGFEQYAPLHTHGSSHGDTRIIRLTPGEGEIYVRLAARAETLWRAWEEKNGAALVRWTGGLMAGPAGSGFVRSCLSLGVQYGRAGALMAASDVDRLTQGAVRFPEDWEVVHQKDAGVIYADAARAFLLREAQAHGALLHHDTQIAAPIENPSLLLDGERHAFDATIVSAGGWTARLLPEFRDMLTVKRRVMGWFKPRAELADMPVICADDADGLYGMPTPEGFYKMGLHTIGEAVDPDAVRPSDAEDAARLAAQARARLPLHDPEPLRLKTCLYTLTPDQDFLIAPSAAHPRVLAFSCCSGHGFKYAPVYGELALAWAEGRDAPEFSAFGRTRSAERATPLGG
jgi:sarcosine oxidase